MKTGQLKQILGERQKLSGCVLLMVIIIFLSLVAHRFLLQCSAVSMVVIFIWTICFNKARSTLTLLNLSTLLCLLFLVCPLDFAVRNSSEWRFRTVPILWIYQRASTDKIIQQGHLVENVDFVAYRGPGDFLRPRWALLLTIPARCKIRTPIEAFGD
jgi:hypothetical protein